jgi:hypothetical protein
MVDTSIDYYKTIKKTAEAIGKLIKTKEWKDDQSIIDKYEFLYKICYTQIHHILVPQRKQSAEMQIREIIAKYIIGYTDTKEKITYLGALKPIETKAKQLQKNKLISREYYARYLELYDKFMALASFRSLEHFALYIEKCSVKETAMINDTGASGGDNRIIANTKDIFSGWYYYANKMVLDGTVKFIEKQLPTSYGKSYSDVILICFIFGQDINNDVLKVFGNPANCALCLKSVMEIMSRKSYAKVFPYYEKFECNENLIFSSRAIANGEFKINGSSKPRNLLCVGKDTSIDGVRAKYIFLDDITQAKDKGSLSEHTKDINKYRNTWRKRSYGKHNQYIIASGTTYSIYDLLSYLKQKFGGDYAETTARNKYTKVAKSNEIIEGGISVFVCVPKLDYDTDESTYPMQFDTETARKDREEDYPTFMAMEQQQPLAPEENPFYYTKLRQYETLPRIGEEGRTEFCCASLDPKRRGKDNVSMPIFCEANDPERPSEKVYFLVDWLYDNRPMKDCIPLIVSKIIQHKITRLYAERNTEECIGMIIEDKLNECGYYGCVVEEVYSTENKESRIMNAEGDIKSKMIFPRMGLYANSNDIGKALMNVYGYSYSKKVAFDDAPDSLALFAKRFFGTNNKKYAKISIFTR